MSITDNLKSVLIIDDDYNEVKDLENILNKEGIYSSYYAPEHIDNNQNKIKNHQIFFIDLMLIDGNTVDNISKIRKILKKICSDSFGSYGLVLWTKHIEDLDVFKDKISKDAENKVYVTPLFIIGLDKSPYQRNGYANLWEDLNKKLRENKSALFFFNWRNSVEKAADKTVNEIYQLASDYKEQHKQFTYLLYKMAENCSGVPTKGLEVYDGMYKDAYRAFDELLYSDLISNQIEFDDIFAKIIEKPEYSFDDELKQISSINSKLLLDVTINNQDIVLPGNVYQIIKGNDLLKLADYPTEGNPIQIAIELTPPCDFSQQKFISRRLIGGFIIDCPSKKKDIKSLKNKHKAGSRYLIWPFDYNGTTKFMCLDFRNIFVEENNNLNDTSLYRLLFSVKHRLFADILQKFSSHAARLGLSILQPNTDK